MGSITSEDGREFQVSIELSIYKDGDFYISYCPDFDLMTYSEKENELDSLMSETIQEFLKYEISKNRLKSTLNSLGWKEVKKSITNPIIDNNHSYLGSFIANTSHQINIPCYS